MNRHENQLSSFIKELERKPKISGINGNFNLGIFEHLAGRRDAQENQLCEYGGGHITPYIDNKSRMFESYIEKVYLKMVSAMNYLVVEAGSLIVEFNLISKANKPAPFEGNYENTQRQAAYKESEFANKERRKAEILTRLAQIKAESDMLDEGLKHHIERANGIFRSRISKYWGGVLSVANEKLEHFPFLEHREFEGRQNYVENRKKLIEMIDETIGGGLYDKA